MQKKQNSGVTIGFRRLQLIILMIFLWSGQVLNGQYDKEEISFFASDSLLVTADHYFTSDTLPYIVMIHEQGSSRGEFSSIIDRFQKMNFNAISVDVRNGGNTNFVANKTARRSRTGGYDRGAENIEADIRAAVNEAWNHSEKPVILLGAGANGSLALKAAKEMEQVKAVIALSPGEYFRPSISIEDTISGIDKPVLITSTSLEYPYMEQIASGIDESILTIFAPENSEGARGTRALRPENPSNGEYWLTLLLFFKDLQ